MPSRLEQVPRMIIELQILMRLQREKGGLPVMACSICTCPEPRLGVRPEDTLKTKQMVAWNALATSASGAEQLLCAGASLVSVQCQSAMKLHHAACESRV